MTFYVYILKKNVIQEESFNFSLEIISLYKYLRSEHNEYTLSQQILSSGTSIGANVEEAIGAESKNDFYHKIAVAYKEARETKYWLRLLRRSGYLPSQRALLLDKVEMLCKILAKILLSKKHN